MFLPLLAGVLAFTAPKTPKPTSPSANAQPGWLAPVGPIPADFRGDPSSLVPTLEGKNGKELGFWAKSPNSSARRDWSEFWWRQLSGRRDLAIQGWALFGDPVSVYLEKVKNEVLVSQPQLRDAIRVYACPSPYVNAMILPDGLILVNMGMMARLADESQVAHVLAHEAAHYALRHAQDAWWEGRQSWGGDRWAKSRFQHSRDRESQADSLAVVYLTASRYSSTGVDSLFGILDASENAMGTRAWTKAALAEFPDLGWSDSFWLDPAKVSVAPLQTEDGDSMHTHPAIPRRRAAAKRLLGDAPRSGETWIVGKMPFEAAREAARREVARGWLGANQPAAALFEAWSLLESHPSDQDLHSVMRQALLELAMDRGATRRSAVRARRIRIWGAYQTLDHFLTRTDDARMLGLGLLAAHAEARSRPGDSTVAGRIAELHGEWAKGLPRHLEYLRDSSRIARSLRHQKPALDLIRLALPDLSVPLENLPSVPDTGWKPIAGATLYLANLEWGEKPLAKALKGVEPGKRIVREQLRTELAKSNIRLVAPDPSAWTADSLESFHRLTTVREWVGDRLDSRGPARFRPQLPELRNRLSEADADLVLVVTVDDGPSEKRFDRSLFPLQASLLGKGSYWSGPPFYMTGAVFDTRDGSVVRVARTTLWETPTDGILAESTRKLAKLLTAER